MKQVIAILILLTSYILVSCNSQNKCDCSQENVCVTIINKTEQPIKTVKLLTHGISQVASGQLENESKTCLSYHSPGENSISLIAILNNGDTVISTEIYSEGGYKFYGTITNDTIIIGHSDNY